MRITVRRLTVLTLAAAVLLFPTAARAQRYTAPDGKLRVALAQQPFSPNGTVPGPRTMASGGVQNLLAELGAAVRVQEAALTAEENTEYGGWKRLGMIEQSGAYDIFAAASTLPAFVKERNPRRIAVNMSEEIGPADGLSHTMYQSLVKSLGEPFASRLVSAERLVSEFRSRRVAAEIVAFGEAAGIAIQLTERALSNEVITVGKTTLEDVAWWMQDRLLERGLQSEFDMPSVYVTGPEGIVATSTARIVQPGDVMMIDWGVRVMNFGTDVKRVAYVLKPGETAPPTSIQAAFDKAIAARDVFKKTIKPGVRADATMKSIDAALRNAGYGVIEFNKPNSDSKTDIVYGFHPVGNTGHDIGPSLTTWQPLQTTFELHRQHIFSFEFFAYTPIAEWGGKKLRIPIEDDAVLMEQGIQFLHSANYRLLVIK